MAVSTALSIRPTTSGQALQRQHPNDTFCKISGELHLVSPSLVQSTWTEGAEMYLAPKEKFCAARDDHLKRVGEALSRRLYPNTPLHQKVLADAIGVTRNSVNNWKLGKCDPGSREMGLLHDFFMSIERGPVFWAEIYGDLAEPMSKRRAGK